MKKRTDFVTNSSSSSFIISRNDISKEKLFEILVEIANKEAERYDDEDFLPTCSLEDIKDDCVTYRYRVTEGTEEKPQYQYDELKCEDIPYTNHYIVDNRSCGRYDWDIIEDVMLEHRIPWEYGYCD